VIVHRHELLLSYFAAATQVIQGWDQGLLGLCVGAKAILVIPPEMGYGMKGAGSIPGGAALKFDVEVVSVNKGTTPVTKLS
jgi:FKBP-type peptidyl-prolyl cis-trans isomerase